MTGGMRDDARDRMNLVARSWQRLALMLGVLLRIEEKRLKRIFAISIPIIGGMLSQSVINLVDAAMVGRLGDAALAGVGIGCYATFITVSVVMGLSAGVQAMVARRQGAGQLDQIGEPLIAGLQLAALIGLPLTLLVRKKGEQ